MGALILELCSVLVLYELYVSLPGNLLYMK